MRGRGFGVSLHRMEKSYAVTWQDGAGPVNRGKLELRPVDSVLEGSDGSSPQTQRVDFGQVTSIHVARTPAERLSGLQTLVINRGSASSLRIAGVAQPGLVSELAEALTILRARATAP